MTVRVVSGLRELADHYDGFILDVWGVIHDGSNPYAGAKETLAELKARGKKTVMLSNAPRRGYALEGLMTGMGIDRSLYGAIMSSGEATHLALSRRDDPWFAALGHRCLHIGPERDKNIFDGLDLELVPGVEQAEFLLNTGPDKFEETVADYAPVLDAAAARHLPMVCANPDLVVIREGVKIICAGALAEYYKDKGGEVRYRGKPDPAIYGACLELLGVADRRRVLAVGAPVRTSATEATGSCWPK